MTDTWTMLGEWTRASGLVLCTVATAVLMASCRPTAACAPPDQKTCLNEDFAIHGELLPASQALVTGDTISRCARHLKSPSLVCWSTNLVDGRTWTSSPRRSTAPHSAPPMDTVMQAYGAGRSTELEDCTLHLLNLREVEGHVPIPQRLTGVPLAGCNTTNPDTRFITADFDPTSNLVAVHRYDKKPGLIELYDLDGHLQRVLPPPADIGPNSPLRVQVLRHTLLVQYTRIVQVSEGEVRDEDRGILVDATTGAFLADTTAEEVQPFYIEGGVFALVGSNELRTVDVRTGKILGRLSPIVKGPREGTPYRVYTAGFAVVRPDHPRHLLVTFGLTGADSNRSLGDVAVVSVEEPQAPRLLNHLRTPFCPKTGPR